VGTDIKKRRLVEIMKKHKVRRSEGEFRACVKGSRAWTEEYARDERNARGLHDDEGEQDGTRPRQMTDTA
jgi:hypothetical protein